MSKSGSPPTKRRRDEVAHEEGRLRPVVEVSTEPQGFHPEALAGRDVAGVLGDGQARPQSGARAEPLEGQLVEAAVGLGHAGMGRQGHVANHGLEVPAETELIEQPEVLGEPGPDAGGRGRVGGVEVGDERQLQRLARRAPEPLQRSERGLHVREWLGSVDERAAQVEDQHVNHRDRW